MKSAGHIRSGAAALLVLAAALVLLFSGLLKVGAIDEFERTLRAHALIGESLIPVAARTIPPVEVCLGCVCVVALCRPGVRPKALWLVAAFFFLLSAYCLALYWRPPAEPSGCGCGFSKGIVRSWASLAFRNGLAASIAGIGGVLAAGKLDPHPIDDREAEGVQPGQVAG